MDYLKLLNSKLEHGDRSVIARELKVTPNSIYNVLSGKMTSKKILSGIIDYLTNKDRLEKSKAKQIIKLLEG